MTRKTYEKMTQPFRDYPKLAKSLHIFNRILTLCVFTAYPVLLLWLMRHRSPMLVRTVLIPMAGYLVLSVFRSLINRERPYERFGLPPVIPKKTKGKSFPSRHVFSAAVIAGAFLQQSGEGFAVCGIVILVCAVLLGVIRVLSGIHYISDVIAGLVSAGIVWAVAYVLLY